MRRTESSKAGAIGLWTATALVIGHTIAVGIFLTPAEVIGSLASPALTIGLWTTCGAVALAGALTFVRAGGALPDGRRAVHLPARRMGRTRRVFVRLAVGADPGSRNYRGVSVWPLDLR